MNEGLTLSHSRSMGANFTPTSSFMNATPSSAPVYSEPSHRPAFKVFFGIIATSAMFGNGLLCLVLLQNRQMLKKPYNMLIFSLAVADFFTGRANVSRARGALLV